MGSLFFLHRNAALLHRCGSPFDRRPVLSDTYPVRAQLTQLPTSFLSSDDAVAAAWLWAGTLGSEFDMTTWSAATLLRIKSNYRTLVLEMHPDKAGTHSTWSRVLLSFIKDAVSTCKRIVSWQSQFQWQMQNTDDSRREKAQSMKPRSVGVSCTQVQYLTMYDGSVRTLDSVFAFAYHLLQSCGLWSTEFAAELRRQHRALWNAGLCPAAVCGVGVRYMDVQLNDIHHRVCRWLAAVLQMQSPSLNCALDVPHEQPPSMRDSNDVCCLYEQALGFAYAPDDWRLAEQRTVSLLFAGGNARQRRIRQKLLASIERGPYSCPSQTHAISVCELSAYCQQHFCLPRIARMSQVFKHMARAERAACCQAQSLLIAQAPLALSLLMAAQMTADGCAGADR